MLGQLPKLHQVSKLISDTDRKSFFPYLLLKDAMRDVPESTNLSVEKMERHTIQLVS